MKNNKIICMGLAGSILLSCSAFAGTTALTSKSKLGSSLTTTQPKLISKKDATSVKTLKVKANENKQFTIILSQTSGTGYSWNYTINSDTIKLIKKSTLDNNTKMLGAPKQEAWTFQASKKGNYEIVFSYAKQWEKGKEALKTVKYNVVVSTANNGASTNIPSPIKDYKTIDEASKAVGFTAVAPSVLPDGYKTNDISVISNKLLQVSYSKDLKNIVYRTAIGNGDISGDYNTYDNTKTITVGSTEVTCKGLKDGIKVATWTQNGTSFSLSFDEPTNDQIILSIIQSIK